MAGSTCPVLLVPLGLLLTGCAAGPHASGDQPSKAEERYAHGAALPQTLGIDEVIARTAAGSPPEDILQRMRETFSVYRLSESEIDRLLAAGVAQPVIEHMTSRKRQDEAQRARERAVGRLARQRGSFWGDCDPWSPARWRLGSYSYSGSHGYQSIGVPLSPPWCW